MEKKERGLTGKLRRKTRDCKKVTVREGAAGTKSKIDRQRGKKRTSETK